MYKNLNRFKFLLLLVICFIFVFASSWGEGKKADRVVLVSFDGLRPDAININKHNAFAKIIAEGASTMNAKTVLPSVTLPSHVSMLTGVMPEHHHVVENNWFPWSPKVKVATVFQLVKRSRKGTAFVCGKEKLGMLNISGSIDRYKFVPFHSKVEKDITSFAVNFLKDPKISLLFIHYPFPDHGGHQLGWMSSGYLSEVNRINAELSRLLNVISQDKSHKTLLIVTADHGGHDKTHGTDSKEDRTIPWIAWGPMVKHKFIITERVNIFDTTAVILDAFDLPIPKDIEGKKKKSIWIDNIGAGSEVLHCCAAK